MNEKNTTMKDENKTKARLIEELRALRRQLSGPGGSREGERNAAETFSESEEMYRHLLEVTPDLIFAVDRAGLFTYVNPRFEEALGYSLDELKGKSFTLVADPEAIALTRDRFKRGMRGEPLLPYEADLIAKGGGKIPVEFNVITLKDAHGKPAGRFGIGRDIAERKRAEEALQESEKKYRSVIENIQDVFYRSDLNGRLLMGSPSGAGMFGFDSIDEMIGLPLDSFWVDPEDRERLLAQIKITGRVRDYEGLLKRRDGTTFNASFTTHFYYNEEGRYLGTEGIIRDITEGKQMENALRESEEKYRATFENALEPIFIIQDGVFKFANRAVTKHSGYSADELRTISFLEFIHPDDRERIADLHRRRLGGENMPSRYEVKCVDNRGKVFHLYASAVSILWEGRTAHLVFTADITEKKQLEAQLQRAQKMEAIGTLAGGIAHDFNNILSAIMGYTEMVLDALPKDGRDHEYLARVFRASERARDLVKQILDFSRQGKQEMRPLMITPLIKEALRLLRASIPASVNIIQDLETDHDLIMADATQIHQVIVNLCTNAAHAMREKGGTLTISLTDRTVRHDDDKPVHDMKPGPYIELAVSDTGHGIDPTILERIFDPFFTTKTRGEGTGMGLSVVHGIIRSHDGYIIVESDVGKGTTFRVYLPVLMEKEAIPLAVEEVQHSGGGKQVLIVDDEPEIAELIEEMLIGLDYRATARTNSLEALELFKTHPRQYDLVIADQTMPDLTGLVLAQALLNIRPDIPIILCTGYSEMVTPDMVEFIGIKAVIMKPILKRQMAETIRQVLETTKGGRKNGSDPDH